MHSDKRPEYEKSIKKENDLVIKIISNLFDIPLAVYSCNPRSFNITFSSFMGVFSASILLLNKVNRF